MNRRIVSLGLCFGFVFGASLVAERSAHAVANHVVEQVQKIVKDGKIVGARLHLLVSPESYANFRVNMAPQKAIASAAKKDDTRHRKTLAGMIGTHVTQQLVEKKGISGTQELYVDIKYGRNVKAGQKINVYSVYTNDKFTKTSTTGPHVFGAWDGPVNQHDATQIVTLPALSSKVPRATKTLTQQ